MANTPGEENSRVSTTTDKHTETIKTPASDNPAAHNPGSPGQAQSQDKNPTQRNAGNPNSTDERGQKPEAGK